VEAIGKIYSPIAWLPPGYEPGAGDGVASAARQRGRFGLGTFWFDDATSENRKRSLHAQAATAGPACPRGAAVTASTANHGGHGGHSGPEWPQQHN
jgi:hypothetical protein